MLSIIDDRTIETTVDFDIHWSITLEPGVWVTEHRGQTVSMTTLYGKRVGEKLHVAFPKGVTRRAGGVWSLRERILVDVLPDDPDQAWDAIPNALRSALEDAYLLSRHDLPDQLGAS